MSKTLTIRHNTLQAPTLDYILMDGSSSMKPRWWPCMGALDIFLDTMKRANINSHGIVHVFDNINLEMVQRDGTLDTWDTFANDPLGSSFGGTPLYDAINLMGRRLRDLAPTRCSIIIVTDGEEYDSEHTNATQAKAILDWCRAQSWQVTFLGADFNNAVQAALLGATPQNTIGVRAQKLLDAGKALGEKRVRNAISGIDINFTDEEKENFGGFLTGPSNG